MSVTCWPTIGARLLGKASRNSSSCRAYVITGGRRPRNAGRVAREHVREGDGAVEAEEGVDAAVVQEAEAADLIAQEVVVAREDAERVRHPEHADLLVQVAEVRDLEELRLVSKLEQPSVPKKPGAAPCSGCRRDRAVWQLMARPGR